MLPDFQLGEEISRGNFGSVSRGIQISTSRVVAIKRILSSSLSPPAEKMLLREIEALQMLNCPYIVSLITSFKDSTYFYIVMEYCSGPDLEKYCRLMGGRIPEALSRKWARQLITGLAEMRRQRIVHRDLKLANIVLTSAVAEEANVKICDFGFARILADETLSESWIGTPVSTAPEVLHCTAYNHKVDVWSLGVILYEMLAGRKLFPARQLGELRRMQENVLTFLFNDAGISFAAKVLLIELLQYDSDKRPEIEELESHPFIQLTSLEDFDPDQGSVSSSFERPVQTSEFRRVAAKYWKTNDIVSRTLLQACKKAIEKKRLRLKAYLYTKCEFSQPFAIKYAEEAEIVKAELALLGGESVDSLALVEEAERLIIRALWGNQKEKLGLLEDAWVLLAGSSKTEVRADRTKEVCQWLFRRSSA